jgi:hypothetical protein
MKLVDVCLFCKKKCLRINSAVSECIDCYPGVHVWYGGLNTYQNFSFLLIKEEYAFDFFDDKFNIRKFFGEVVYSKLYPMHDPFSLGIRPDNAIYKLKTYLIML